MTTSFFYPSPLLLFLDPGSWDKHPGFATMHNIRRTYIYKRVLTNNLFSGERNFTGLSKNPEFAAAIQKSFANQVGRQSGLCTLYVYPRFVGKKLQ
jgi:hypothetical protein